VKREAGNCGHCTKVTLCDIGPNHRRQINTSV